MKDESEEPMGTGFAGIPEKSGEGKVRIKLKFPRIEESGAIEAKPEDRVRVCEFCNKGFSSGKALGGHMRVHVEENRGDSAKIGQNPSKVSRNSIKKSQHLDFLSKNSTCHLCGKGFSSLQSLFGHMRCHPEREYRGMQPPETGPNHLSSSSVSDETTVHPQSYNGNPKLQLPIWSVKAKRGRKSLIPSATSSSSGVYGLSEEEKEVVNDLMMLAHGESFSPILPSKHKIEATNTNALNVRYEIGYKDRVFESKRQKIDHLRYGSEFKKPKFTETAPFEAKGIGKALFGSSQNSISDDESGGINLGGSVSNGELIIENTMSNKKKIVKKMQKFRVLKSVEKEVEGNENVVGKGPVVSYKCTTCNKCFPSHQALGGHKSSHNKLKNANQALDSEFILAPKPDDYPPIGRGKDKNEFNVTDRLPFHPVPIHQCTICHKNFPTGQALGGHKRCHWVGPMEGSTSSHTTSLPGEKASETRALGFDLNEMPPMDEEHGEVESHPELQLHGYAS